MALTIASLACGGLAGFLVGGPGLGSGDDLTRQANERGWADRLGVFGNWVTGAAFVLVTANAAEIADWFARLTRSVGRADRAVAQEDMLYQYALGAWMIAAAALGFTFGFMQMVTTGRTLISKAAAAAAQIEKAAEAATAAAAKAEAASEAAKEMTKEMRSLVETA